MSIPTQILDLLLQGESNTLEFKEHIREPLILARLIVGFANGNGGRILVGVKEPPEIVGVDKNAFLKTFEAAIKLIEPAVKVSASFIDTMAGPVADIQIEKSSTVVVVQGSAFIRAGTLTRPMEWTQMLTRLPPKPPQANLETVLQENQKQTTMLGKVLDELEKVRDDNKKLNDKLNDPKARKRERWIGGAIGVAGSLVAALIWLLATKQIPWLKT